MKAITIPSLRWRLVAVMCLAYIVVAVTTLIASYQAQDRNLRQQLTDRAASDAAILAAGSQAPLLAGSTQSETLQQFVSSLERQTTGLNHAIVTDDYGKILASTQPSELGHHISIKLSNLLKSAKTKTDNLPGGDVRGVAVITGPLPIGVAEVTLSGGSIQKDLNNSLALEILVRVLGLVLFVMLSLLIARYILAPLGRLVRASSLLRTGDLSARVPVTGGGELATLAETFNDMAETMEQRINHLSFLATSGSQLPSIYRKGEDVTPMLAEFCRQLGALGAALLPCDSEDEATAYTVRPMEEGWLERIAPSARVVNKPSEFLQSELSYMAVPVLGDVVFVVARDGNLPFSLEERQVVTNFANQIGITADNALLLDSQREALQVKDQFLSIVSHELRTPITTIKGYAQMLMRKFEDDPQTLRFAGNIEAQASRLSRLVDDLLDVTRFSRGQFELMPQSTDLHSLIEDVLARFRLVSPHHKFTANLQGGNLQAVWDRDRLEQVLNNLVGNAVKYSPNGGTVSVSTRREDDHVVVSVRDQGIGIPEDELQRLFERFYRVTRDSSDVKGLGLGLYVTRRIVEAHGGTVGVRSRVGEGSEFFFTLPLAPVPALQETH